MLYALNEQAEGSSLIEIPEEEARGFNAKLFGIFRAVNSFNGARRIVNLTHINAWFVEMDGDKPAQLLRIKDSPIYPSRVVESKNGYHVYFNAIEARLENYAAIEEGLIHCFLGDKRAKDVTRVLREPGFYHWKDINDPFKVKELFRADVAYRDKDMLHFFPAPKEDEPESIRAPKQLKHVEFTADSLTEFLNGLDNEDALERLSGTRWVNHESYTFKEVAGGKKNIYVNGKSTSCFIDEKKRIGATHGPNVFSWLRYFNHSDRDIYQILKEIYNEQSP